MARKHRYSIYDMMDERGVFEENPANTCSPKYQGPVQYPKMLYHPSGQTRITQKAEILKGPYGPEAVGEQRELISKTVASKEEEDEALLAGWHTHPARSIAAGGGDVPQVAPANLVTNLEEQIRLLNAQLAAARQPVPAVRKTA